MTTRDETVLMLFSLDGVLEANYSYVSTYSVYGPRTLRFSESDVSVQLYQTLKYLIINYVGCTRRVFFPLHL